MNGSFYYYYTYNIFLGYRTMVNVLRLPFHSQFSLCSCRYVGIYKYTKVWVISPVSTISFSI
jgi:hypothetical protein